MTVRSKLWNAFTAIKRSAAVLTDVDKVLGGWKLRVRLKVLKYQNAPNSFPQKDLPLLKEINSFLKSVITCFCVLYSMNKPCSLRNKAEWAKGIWKAKQSFLWATMVKHSDLPVTLQNCILSSIFAFSFNFHLNFELCTQCSNCKIVYTLVQEQL